MNGLATVHNPVTSRELQVWKLLAEGHDLESTGNFLGISVHTVRTYHNNLSHKLGIVHTGGIRAKLTRLWMEKEKLNASN